MKYSFKRQFRRGQKAERYIDTLFADQFNIKPANRSEERRGIDRHFVSRDGKHYSIQYKADKTAARTGNAFVEIISVDTKNIPGWAYTCEADFIFYYIDDIGPIYILRPKDIKKKLKRWERKYQTRAIPNKGYNTIGLLVPLDEFERLAVQIKDA